MNNDSRIQEGISRGHKVVVTSKALTGQGNSKLTTRLADQVFTMTLEYEKKGGDEPSSAAEVLAEMTDRSEEEFQAEGYYHPSLEELEIVPKEKEEG